MSCRLSRNALQSGPILEARWNSECGPAMETEEARSAAAREETSKVTTRHGRRLNGKTKVTNLLEVKEEMDYDAAQDLQELTPAEVEALWLQVKQEIKEEMEAEAWPSSAAAPVKKEVASEVMVKQEPVDGGTSKRRRLQTPAGLLDPVAIKKEAMHQADVKHEVDDQACKDELTPEEMEAMWLEVKQEIKEEMEAEVTGAGQTADVSGTSVKRQVVDGVKTEVRVKRELLDDGNQDGSIHDSQREQPADPATPKRRRLTRRDLETPAKQAVDTAPPKQERANQVKVKKEVKTEHTSQDGRKRMPSEMERILFEVKQEISEGTASDIKQEVNGVFEASIAEGITVKKELLEDDNASRRDSLDAFVAKAAAWAKQCMIFRSSKTWTPTRHKPGFRHSPIGYEGVRAELFSRSRFLQQPLQ